MNIYVKKWRLLNREKYLSTTKHTKHFFAYYIREKTLISTSKRLKDMALIFIYYSNNYFIYFSNIYLFFKYLFNYFSNNYFICYSNSYREN